VGSIVSLDYAEEIIGNGWADFVSMCRPLMADPDMPRKYAEDRPEDRRPCLRCDACAKHLMTPKPTFCAVNPMSAMTSELRDGVVPKARVKKKVAIVGGGPAGIQALQTLLDRGHEVTLYEKGEDLGGHVIEAAVPPFKNDVRDYLRWMRHTAEQCKARGARILLNTEATADMLTLEGYDALVLALGADPIVPKLPGIDGPNVLWAPDAEAGKAPVGQRIAVIGGSAVGMEAALDFSLQGKDVFVVEMLDAGPAGSKLHTSAGSGAAELTRIFQEREIPVYYGKSLVEVRPDAILCRDTHSGKEEILPCDTVLLAVGLRPRQSEAEAMRHCAPETSVFVVGDGKKAASICEAVNEAFQVCLHI
jgi:NADPH-dependent 2,4-dienoyl-CoA reductase/sulfur reductase-like enzyme